MRRIAARMLAPALVMVTLGCAPDRAEPGDPTPDPGAPGAAAPAPSTPGRPALQLAPAGGPPGTEVALSLSGLAMNEGLEVGFGDLNEHVILAPVQADPEGNLAATVTIPADAAPGPRFFFLQSTESGQVVSTPTVFLVSPADGRVTITGRMSDEGVECPAMRGDAGELYTLTGPDDWPEPGTRVRVTGTIAEMSICQQGLTIAVASIEALP